MVKACSRLCGISQLARACKRQPSDLSKARLLCSGI